MTQDIMRRVRTLEAVLAGLKVREVPAKTIAFATVATTLSASGNLCLTSIDRVYRLAIFSQSFSVIGTHDASNYWRIRLVSSPNVFVSFDSYAHSGNYTTTAFLIAETTQNYLVVDATKVGSPANLFVYGPLLRVQ